MKRKISLLLVLALCASMLCGFTSGQNYQKCEYQGSVYPYNSRIRTVLLLGVDTDGDFETYDRYTVAPRADAIALLILDGYSKTIRLLSVSRDTMTEIQRYTMDGTDRGTYVSHLGYAFTYGDGGKKSCQNTLDAVSNLLGGIPIHGYVAVTRSGIPKGNALVGGVRVTVPNDDVSALHSELTSGAAVTLTEDNVEDFMSYRDTAIPFSNEGRIQRQQAFLTGLVEQLRDKVAGQPEVLWSQFQALGGTMQTNISKSQYLKLADSLSSYSFTPEDCFRLEGENVTVQDHDQVLLDPDTVAQTVLKLFYLPAE